MSAGERAQARLDHIAKPLRSLGRLEELIVQLADIQGTEDVRIAPRCALVFCGEGGLDEIWPDGLTFVTELKDGAISSKLLSAAQLLGETFPADDLAGGTPEENAELMRGVLSGRIRGAKRAATLLNAAAAICAGGKADTLADAVAQARASLDTGTALAKLEALVAFRA